MCLALTVAAALFFPQACHAQLAFDKQPLFVGGEGGYHTYRIPSMAQTPDGVLYAFAEARKNSASDTGDIDLVMRRSSDNGLTWSPMELLFDDGANTVGQPTPIVNQATGELLLMFSINNMSMFVSQFDSDAGAFGTPVDITDVTKSLDVPFSINRMGAGPTAGVQTESGRLIAPVWVNETIGVANVYRTGVLYSDDGGATWLAGGVPDVPAEIAGTNESTVAILPDGTLYMTQRTNAGVPKRAFSVSEDDGMTWTAAELVPEIDPDMTTIKAGLTAIEPRGASDTTGLLITAPEGPGRSNMALWFSPDSAEWSRISAINSGPAGYSELIQLEDGFAGLLFEEGQNQFYERLSFARLEINEDTLWSFNGIGGDVNQDGIVNMDDVQQFINNWDGRATYTTARDSYANGDLNFDGRNDLYDVALFRQYLRDAGVNPAALHSLPVPEPAAAVICLVTLHALRIVKSSRDPLFRSP